MYLHVHKPFFNFAQWFKGKTCFNSHPQEAKTPYLFPCRRFGGTQTSQRLSENAGNLNPVKKKKKCVFRRKVF